MAAVIDKTSVKRVLVVRLGAIGDCLRVLPALARWFWRHHTGRTAVPFPMRKGG